MLRAHRRSDWDEGHQELVMNKAKPTGPAARIVAIIVVTMIAFATLITAIDKLGILLSR